MDRVQKLLVQERLSLAKRILEQGEQLRDSSLIEHNDNGWTHPYLQHDALVNYLLLTCFDLLGQPDEWLTFSNWLVSNKAKHEREEAAKAIANSATPIEAAQQMYAAYQKKYGVKTSFYRFIDEVLDGAERERLLFSVKIEQKTKNEQLVTIDDPNKKKAFLYDSRNLFTHQSIPTGSPTRGVWPESIIVENNKLLWGYLYVRNKNFYSYLVRRWPFELFEIISNAIEQPIEVYDFDIECRAWVVFEDNKQVVVSNIKFPDLRDLNGLIDFAKNGCNP